MNKDNAKDFLPLVQALADGKTIQYHNGSEWLDMTRPTFVDEFVKNYRIKPEPRKPREFFMSLRDDGTPYTACVISKPLNTYPESEIIRVREIIEK